MIRWLCLVFLLSWTVLLAAATKPKLVFLLVIDQFRADYLEKHRAAFGPGGFNRLLARGAVFVNTNYDYAGTETAPGHATIATGSNPSSHGIVANEWYDRTKKGRIFSIEDSRYKLIGVTPQDPGASPVRLVGSTLADEIRLAGGEKSKAVGLSLKDRSAILPAGRMGMAFWFDYPSGRATTSTYYMDALPAWVEDFNQKHGLNQYVGKEWQGMVIQKYPAAAPALPPNATPFANDVLFDLARRVIEQYQLGQGPATDFLSVSLSANDHLGHAKGPDSPLMADMIRRTDRSLDEFFTFLDQRTGSSFLTAFSADHGVMPNSEELSKRKIEAGRVEEKDIAVPVEAALREAYHSAADEKWLADSDIPNLYLNRDLIQKYRLNTEEVARRAGQAALKVPGVLGYMTAGQLARREGDGGMVAHRMANNYFPERSGDLVLVWKPFYIRSYLGVFATHSSPWSYDTHVPLIFMGPGIRPGVYQTAATPADLAVTVAAVLGINQPAGATGRVLVEAIGNRATEAPRTPRNTKTKE